jgi:acetamidase/formamidase
MGDLHARMGRGEPLGSGLECGGIITGRVQLAKQRRILGPLFCTAARVGFVGTSNVDWRDAEAVAVRAAWEWLTLECGMAHEDATVVAAALLEVDAGGPAGNNVVASFPTADLLSCGVEPGTWPMGELSTQGDRI